MRLVIDLNACAGHGRCYAEAPDLVEADDEGRGVVLQTEVPKAMHHQARLAAEGCPEHAVRLEH
jgi:ferredoxin